MVAQQIKAPIPQKNDCWAGLAILDFEDPIFAEAIVEAIAANTIEIKITFRGFVGSIEPAIEAIPAFLDSYSENIAVSASASAGRLAE